MTGYLTKFDDNFLRFKLRTRSAIDKYHDAYLERLYKWPSVFLLVGIVFVILILLPAGNIDPTNLVTDAVDLVSPMNSRSRLHQEQLIKAFPNSITSKIFYDHQRILEGFELTVIYRTRDNVNILKETVLEDVTYIHTNLINYTLVSSSDDDDDDSRVYSFYDLCVKRNEQCYVHGDFVLSGSLYFDALKVVSEFNGPNSNFYVSSILGKSSLENRTLLYANTLKLRYYLSSEKNKKEMSKRWIQSAIKRIYSSSSYYYSVETSLQNCPNCTKNISIYMNSILSRDLVNIDFTLLDWLFKLTISFSIPAFMLVLSYWFFGIAVAFAITIGSWGIISFIGNRMVSMSVIAVILIIGETWMMMGCTPENTMREMKDRQIETLSTTVYLLVFAIGLSSQFYIIQQTSLAICLSSFLLMFVYMTIVSPIRVLEKKYIKNLVIHFCPSVRCLFCFCGCNFREREGVNEDQSSMDTVKDKLSSICGKEVSSEKNLTLLFVFKLSVFTILYVAYIAGSIYGMFNFPMQPLMCELADPDRAYMKYCSVEMNNYKNEFWITMFIKHKHPLRFHDSIKDISDYIQNVKSDKCIRNDTEINWMKSFQSDRHLYTSMTDFLDKNKQFVNDVVLQEDNRSIGMSRIYLAGRDWSNTEVIKECMLKLQDFEYDAPTKPFFYAPEFHIYEGYVSSSRDLLRIAAIASALCLFLIIVTVQKSMMHILFVMIIPFISSCIGMIGYMPFFGFPLTFYDIIPFLFLLSTMTLYSHSFKVMTVVCWCYGLFSCGVFMLIFRDNAYVFNCVFLPLILFTISGMLHYLIFVPRLVNPWLKDKQVDTDQEETTVTLETNEESLPTIELPSTD